MTASKSLEHLPYINFVPISDISLENVKIKMKLVVKYNLWKYAENEKMSQPENTFFKHTKRYQSRSCWINRCSIQK